MHKIARRYTFCLLLMCLPLQSLVVAVMPVQMLASDATEIRLPMPCHDVAITDNAPQDCNNCSLCHLFRTAQLCHFSIPDLVYKPIQNPIITPQLTSYIPDFPERPPQN